MNMLSVNVALLAFFIFSLSSGAVFATWLLIRVEKAKKTLILYYKEPGELKDLSDDDYEKVIDAGFLVGKNPREIEEEKRLYPGVSVFDDPRSKPWGEKEILVRSDPPEPSSGDGDHWCAKCSRSANCEKFRSGRFCDGFDYQEKKEDGK